MARAFAGSPIEAEAKLPQFSGVNLKVESEAAESKAGETAIRMKRWRALEFIVMIALLAVSLPALIKFGGRVLEVSAGAQLPAGKIPPQLVNASGNVGVLLSPEGRLWYWGSSNLPAKTGLAEELSPVPHRIEAGRDVVGLGTGLSTRAGRR